MRVSVEVCVASLPEARAAIAAGVDSVEACAWLACGGITPSMAFVERVAGMGPKGLRVLCRPGPGGFRYAPEELGLMVADAARFQALAGAPGIVIGGFGLDGTVPWPVFSGLHRSLECTFHRAIDHAADMPGLMEQAIGQGFRRILTSGGKTLALDGVPMLRRLVEQAAGRIAIAAAGGIDPANVVELVQRTGVREVHFAAQKPAPSTTVGAAMSSAHSGGSFETEPDAAKIEGVLNALVKAGLR